MSSLSDTETINRLKKWPNLLEQVRNLNIKGYIDTYHKDIHANICFGWFDENFKYVILSITSDMEICLVGFETPEEVLDNWNESNWKTESIWLNDIKIRKKDLVKS